MRLKFAILSDIHGNLSALHAVTDHIMRWQPDVVLINGDVVNRGPLSADCWRFVRERVAQDGWLQTKGNHEDYVLGWEDGTRTLAPLEREMFQSSKWTYDRMRTLVPQMATLPHDYCYEAADGSMLIATHATLESNRIGIVPWHTDERIIELIDTQRPIFVTSHTHHFFTRRVNGMLLVNTGSVGCPFDGDTRTGYAQVVLEDGRFSAELIRLTYDRDATSRAFDETGFEDGCGPVGRLMRREWQDGLAYIPRWFRECSEPVKVGKQPFPESVDQFLASI